MSKITIPNEVEELLAWWLPQTQKALGPKLKSVVLFGGVTMGDFMPGWSDVDVCVVLHSPITEQEGLKVGSIHDEMHKLFVQQANKNWESGQVIEGPYVPFQMVTDAEKTMPCYIAGGTTRKFANCNPITPFDRYMLSHFGVLYFGEAVSFSPPTRDDLVAQSKEDIGNLISPGDEILNSSIWLTGMLHWIARSMIFWRDGELLSKTAALEREVAAGSTFAEPFRLALRLRKAGSTATKSHLEELRTHFISIAKEAGEQLERFLNESCR